MSFGGHLRCWACMASPSVWTSVVLPVASRPSTTMNMGRDFSLRLAIEDSSQDKFLLFLSKCNASVSLSCFLCSISPFFQGFFLEETVIGQYSRAQLAQKMAKNNVEEGRQQIWSINSPIKHDIRKECTIGTQLVYVITFGESWQYGLHGRVPTRRRESFRFLLSLDEVPIGTRALLLKEIGHKNSFHKNSHNSKVCSR